MKYRKHLIVSILSILVLLCACDSHPQYANEYYNSRWQAQEADIYFDVSEDFVSEIGADTKGRFVESDSPFTVVILPGGHVYFLPLSATVAPDGTILDSVYMGEYYIFGSDDNMTSKSFTLNILDRQLGILDESITELTFIREDIPEE